MWRREDDVQKMLRESIDSFALAAYPPARVRASRSSETGFDIAAWKQMAELGWVGILLDEDVGGAGLKMGPALTLADGFGRHVLTEPFIATAVIAATILAHSRTGQAREIATRVASGDAVVTLAWQETVNQTGFAPGRTSLVTRNGAFCLTGSKVFVPGWTETTLTIVAAVHEGEAILMMARPSQAKVHKMADGTSTADLVFDNVELADGDILMRGASASLVLELALTRGTVALCAQLEGLAAAALDMTIAYMNERCQFGQALAEFQALRHRIVDLHAEVELAGASWRLAADLLEERGAHAARVSASAAKARSSQTALDVAKTALQYHGAFGYTDEADIGLYLNGALRLSSWLGNSLPHRRRAFELRREISNHA